MYGFRNEGYAPGNECRSISRTRYIPVTSRQSWPAAASGNHIPVGQGASGEVLCIPVIYQFMNLNTFYVRLIECFAVSLDVCFFLFYLLFV